MKKIYLLFVAAACAFSAGAADLKISVMGREVAPGEAVCINDSYFADATEYFPEIFITGSETAPVTVTTKFTRNETPELDADWLTGAKVDLMFCALDGKCETMSVGQEYTKSGNLEAGKETALLIDVALRLGYDQEFSDLTIDYAFDVICNYAGQDYTITCYAQQNLAAVSEIAADDAAPVFFDLQGRKVTNPEKGLYIKRQGNKTSKVIL